MDPLSPILLIIVLIVTVGIAFLGYITKWQWTGMSEYQGQNPEGRAVSFWMWLSVLIVPATIGLAGYLFAHKQHQSELTTQQKQNQNNLEVQARQAQNTLEVQARQAQDDALQAYFDQMGELLLGYDLRESEEDSPKRDLARAKTLTVVRRLDPANKGSVVQFLHESALIQETNPIVRLVAADLTNVELGFAKLENINLRYSYLNRANLHFADLNSANLRACADRLATFHLWRFSERLNRLHIAR